MLWIFTNGSHKIIYSAEQVTHFFESGGFYYGSFFVQKIGKNFTFIKVYSLAIMQMQTKFEGGILYGQNEFRRNKTRF